MPHWVVVKIKSVNVLMALEKCSACGKHSINGSDDDDEDEDDD